MKSDFLSAAKKEMKETILYYERRSKGLGLSFAKEINRMISLLKAQPELGQLIEKNVSRILTKKFPYAIIYAVDTDLILIIAIAHQRRLPKYWYDRLDKI